MRYTHSTITVPAARARTPRVRHAVTLALALLACSPLAASAATANTDTVEATLDAPVANCCEWGGDGRGK